MCIPRGDRARRLNSARLEKITALVAEQERIGEANHRVDDRSSRWLTPFSISAPRENDRPRRDVDSSPTVGPRVSIGLIAAAQITPDVYS